MAARLRLQELDKSKSSSPFRCAPWCFRNGVPVNGAPLNGTPFHGAPSLGLCRSAGTTGRKKSSAPALLARFTTRSAAMAVMCSTSASQTSWVCAFL